MTDLFHLLPIDRRSLLAGGLAAVTTSTLASALTPRLTQKRLAAMIKQALSESKDIKFARPDILGLHELVAREITRKAPNTNYWFAAGVPERENTLVFFRGREKPVSFAMHRTGTHLRRLASARNIKGTLTPWSGEAADADSSPN